MLHTVVLIAIFNGLGDDIISNVSAIHKIIFKITISAGNYGFADISLYAKALFFKACREKIGSNLPTIHLIDHIF